MQKQLTVSELQQCIERRDLIDPQSVLTLLSGCAEEQQSANRGLYLNSLRHALRYLGALANAEAYTNQATLDLLQQLSEPARYAIPLLDMRRDMAIHMIERGLTESGLHSLEAIAPDIWSLSAQSSFSDPQAFLQYMHDPKTDAALKVVARDFKSIPFSASYEGTAKKRVVLIASSLIGENSLAAVIIAIARLLQERGYEVTIAATEYWCPSSPYICEDLKQRGLNLEIVPHTNAYQKIMFLHDVFTRLRADVALYCINPMDYVGKVLSEIGVAPAQCMLNTGYEHYCGKFDYVLQTTSPEQERATFWPGKSKYIGSFAAREAQMVADLPLNRSEIGLADDAVALITHGNMAKCSVEYIAAAVRILLENPHAMLVLAGPCSDADIQRLNDGFSPHGLAHRIKLLGTVFDRLPSLLKACDIYLDPFPWPGGQSTLEAMWANMPIVSMQCREKVEGDPESYGPASSATDMFLPQSYERASPGDYEAYIAMAGRYIRDSHVRSHDGAALRTHVEQTYSAAIFATNLERYLVLAMQAHQAKPKLIQSVKQEIVAPKSPKRLRAKKI